TPRTTPYVEPDDGPALASDVPGGGTAGGLEHPEGRALVGGVGERHGARPAPGRVTRPTCNFVLLRGSSSVELVLEARDEQARALARTASFNLHYRAVTGPDRETLAAIVREAVGALRERDRGDRRLDRRKGLVGEEALRKRA